MVTLHPYPTPGGHLVHFSPAPPLRKILCSVRVLRHHGIEETRGIGDGKDILGHGAGLGEEREVALVTLKDAIEADEAHDERTRDGYAAAAQTGATAARHDGDAVLARQLEDRRDFLGRAGKDDGPRQLFQRRGAVERVRNDVLPRSQDIRSTEEGGDGVGVQGETGSILRNARRGDVQLGPDR